MNNSSLFHVIFIILAYICEQNYYIFIQANIDVNNFNKLQDIKITREIRISKIIRITFLYVTKINMITNIERKAVL